MRPHGGSAAQYNRRREAVQRDSQRRRRLRGRAAVLHVLRQRLGRRALHGALRRPAHGHRCGLHRAQLPRQAPQAPRLSPAPHRQRHRDGPAEVRPQGHGARACVCKTTRGNIPRFVPRQPRVGRDLGRRRPHLVWGVRPAGGHGEQRHGLPMAHGAGEAVGPRRGAALPRHDRSERLPPPAGTALPRRPASTRRSAAGGYASWGPSRSTAPSTPWSSSCPTAPP